MQKRAPSVEIWLQRFACLLTSIFCVKFRSIFFCFTSRLRRNKSGDDPVGSVIIFRMVKALTMETDKPPKQAELSCVIIIPFQVHIKFQPERAIFLLFFCYPCDERHVSNTISRGSSKCEHTKVYDNWKWNAKLPWAFGIWNFIFNLI